MSRYLQMHLKLFQNFKFWGGRPVVKACRQTNRVLGKALFILIFFICVFSLPAQMTVSGILDSSVSMQAGHEFSLGFEEYANIRFQTKIRDRAVVFGAVNLIAAAGDYAVNAAALSSGSFGFSVNTSGYIAGENYIAGIELERLYFRLNFEAVDLDGGLFRLPFGYSSVWGSSDFLNPKNPLKPDARARAVLGAGLSYYPVDEVKLLGFFASPRNPFLNDGRGILAGLSSDFHWARASLQGLYSYEFPKNGSAYGIHRAGFSLKADIEAGVLADMLYTYNHEAKTGIDGLSLSLGADYSFFNGNLIILTEYLYNGKTSSTAFSPENILGMPNRSYIYSGFTWRFNDFTNAGAAFIISFDEFSIIPVITVNHELFQGVALTIMMQTPLDRDIFNGGGRFRIICNAGLRMRF